VNEKNQPASAARVPTPVNIVERKSRVFEYMGAWGRKIIGASTGQTYFFRFHGHRITIPQEDALAMMRESDVRMLTQV
jgi:hypothetical protein